MSDELTFDSVDFDRWPGVIASMRVHIDGEWVWLTPAQVAERMGVEEEHVVERVVAAIEQKNADLEGPHNVFSTEGYTFGEATGGAWSGSGEDHTVEVEQWWFGIQGDPMGQRHLYRDREQATAAAEAHHAKTGDYVIVGYTRAGVETTVVTIPGLLSDAPPLRPA